MYPRCGDRGVCGYLLMYMIITNGVSIESKQHLEWLVDFAIKGQNFPFSLSILISEYNTSTEKLKYILFVKPTDPKHELWNGPTIGESAAVAYFKADEVITTLFDNGFTDPITFIWAPPYYFRSSLFWNIRYPKGFIHNRGHDFMNYMKSEQQGLDDSANLLGWSRISDMS